MFLQNKKIIVRWYITALIFIFIGVIVGSLYYTYNFLKSADIKNYLDGYTNSLRNGMDFTNIIKKSLKNNAIMFVIVAVASFFKHGFLISAFFLVRKGFISAFTTSAMIDVYGFKGLTLAIGSVSETLVFIPLLCFFSAISAFVSKNRHTFEKRDKIIYIIFLMVVFTIFCGCALLEGITTTTFMKWLAFKVT